MNKAVMLDIETMGTKLTAPIISIGAVVFDDKDLYDQFYMVPEWEGIPELSTIEWWMTNASGRIDELCLGKSKTPVKTVLSELVRFVGKMPVYGFGSNFDNAIVRASCERNGVQCWTYRQDMCFRTVVNLFDPERQLKVKPDNPHNALSDAIAQANWMQRIFEHPL